jgi:phosphatidylserine decarboxylase
MRNTNTPVAVESLPFIGIGLALAMLSFFLHWLVPLALALAFTGFVLFFFRNPQRTTPFVTNGVVAPADGCIVYLGPATEEHLDGEVQKISIFMSVFNVHINRAPVTGKVVDSFYCHGKFLDVRDERATFENERQGLVIETDAGQRLTVVQVAGLIARRIVCYAVTGSKLEQGRRYGLIRFGSRLDVYLPQGTEIKVRLGERTVAGETILGILP